MLKNNKTEGASEIGPLVIVCLIIVFLFMSQSGFLYLFFIFLQLKIGFYLNKNEKKVHVDLLPKIIGRENNCHHCGNSVSSY
jgi:hypothetical protein